MERLIPAAPALLIAVLMGGCGGAGDEGVRVTGSVVRGGAGIDNVLVVFWPRGSDNPKGVRTDPSGKFELRLPPGQYTVLLSKKVDAQGNPPAEGQDADELEESGLIRESFPEQYSSRDNALLGAEIPAAGVELPPFVVE